MTANNRPVIAKGSRAGRVGAEVHPFLRASTINQLDIAAKRWNLKGRTQVAELILNRWAGLDQYQTRGL